MRRSLLFPLALAVAVLLSAPLNLVAQKSGSTHSSSSHSTSQKSTGSHASSKSSSSKNGTSAKSSSKPKTSSSAKPSKPATAKPKSTATSKSKKASTATTHTTTHHNSNYCQSCARDKNGKILRGEAAKDAFKAHTGYPKGRPGYVIDHIVPLACGGADNTGNMQWQTVEQSKAKDRVERKGCTK